MNRGAAGAGSSTLPTSGVKNNAGPRSGAAPILFLLVWSGHSCPLLSLLLLTLTLRFGNPKNKPNPKSGGQECPPHTNC
jgi:hypothetical protein